jgi:tagatose-6-phosphate ketose/aldose isomerase
MGGEFRMTSTDNPGSITWNEILQQPATWLTTLARLTAHPFSREIRALSGRAIITGAGTSAYAAAAIESAWPSSRAIPTTDILTLPARHMEPASMMLSLARSGNSPESVAAVDRLHRFCPTIPHYAVTCNAEGALARHPLVRAIVLDPRTNDRSLAMTSSFSNLVLAGLCISDGSQLAARLPGLCDSIAERMASLQSQARVVAETLPSRAVVLASRSLLACAHEIGLKFLELTAGKVAVMVETFLGLRHGPLSFLDRDTLVLAVLSTDAKTRAYEEDLLAELRAKRLGRLIGIAPPSFNQALLDEFVPAIAPDLPDWLRTPFEVVYGQMLGYHLSLRAGLNPDNPSPGGIITRVVQGVTIHED